MTAKYWLAALGVVLAGTSYGVLTSDNFEGYSPSTPLNNQGQWKASSSSVVAQTNIVHWGAKAAVVTVSASLSNTVDHATTEKVWSDFFTVPRFYVSDTATGPAADPNATAQFYITSNGYWAVINYNGSAVVTNTLTRDIYGATLPAMSEASSNWLHVSVLHDYVNKKWSLFVNDVPVATNLGFINQTITSYKWFNMQNGGGDSAWLDDVAITNRTPSTLTADTDHNGLPDAWEIQYFGAIGIADPNADPDHDGLRNIDEASMRSNPNDASDPGAVPMAAALPFYENFDNRQLGGLYGQNGWGAAPTNSLIVEGAVSFMGGQALRMVGGSQASHTFLANGAATSVWTHLVLKPILMTEAQQQGSLVQSATVAFYVDTNRQVNAYNGSNYVVLPNIIGGTNTGSFLVDTGKWVRFVTKSDYSTRKWSLYAQNVDSASTSAYARLLAQDLNFNTAASAYTTYQGLFVTNLPDPSVTGYLDSVEITLTTSPWIDTDGNGVPDYFEQATYGSSSVTNPAVGDDLAAYAWGGTNYGSILSANIKTNTRSVQLAFNVGKDRTYSVSGGASPSGPLTNYIGSFYTGYNGTNATFVHSNALALYSRYFYRLSAVSPDGVASNTTTIPYAWYQQPRTNMNYYYWAAVPVDYASGGNTLGSTLGAQLAGGLVGGNLASGDQITLFTTNTPPPTYTLMSGVWYDTNAVPASGVAIAPGTGMLIYRRNVAAASTNIALFSGLVRTGTVASIALNPGWNLVSWPYDTSAVQTGWGLTSANCAANNDPALSDIIYIDNRNRTHPERTDAFIQMRLWGDNVWRFVPDSQVDSSTIQLLPGEGVFVRHTGSATQWQPAKP